MVNIIALEERGLAFELCLDWPNFYLHHAAVGVALNFLQLCAWQAGGNELNVGENFPCLGNGHIDGEVMI